MQKTEKSNSCSATLSAFGYEHEEDEDENSDVWYDPITDTESEEDGNCPEDSEEFEQDGTEHKDPRLTSDDEEYGSRYPDTYKADSEDQDTDTDTDSDEDHRITNPRGDEHETSNLKPDKESSQEIPHDENNLHNPTPTPPQVSNRTHHQPPGLMTRLSH